MIEIKYKYQGTEHVTRFADDASLEDLMIGFAATLTAATYHPAGIAAQMRETAELFEPLEIPGHSECPNNCEGCPYAGT